MQEDLIKLYLNHRPVLPLDKQLINGAFTTIAQHLNFPSTNTISWDALQHCLLNEGEPISNDDLNAFLVALTGANSDSISPDSAYNAKIFSEQLLGFEDFQSNDW